MEHHAVKEKKGEICIIESNPDVQNVLATLGVLMHIRLLASEEDLLEVPADR
jgi:anti-anti-sigma regulatory factor